MAKYIDLDTLKFQLFGVHDLASVLQQERYADHDQESIELFLQSIKDFSDKDLFPYFQEMDEKPVVFENGEIKVHPQVGNYMRKAGELGLVATVFDYEAGGLQMPLMSLTAAAYIQEAANNHLPGYIGLTLGAAELIVHFASQELQDTYVPNMLEAKWGGTMCLTEPQAGSSLSDITTTAYPQEDGSYRIKGQKIFISGGDHPHVENVVHLLLARIDGAPAGTKGISLFVVPKKRPEADGSLTNNDVITTGDFQKMGQKGYCTTHLIFGEQDDCHAWLVGEANQGLRYMFMMMNGARIAVGRGAAAITMAAYQASLNYAKERSQGRLISSSGKKDVAKEQTLIINHPDVRRMLLLQKCIAEGSLSLVLQTARYHDLSITHSSEEERKKYYLLLEILTPLAKTYPSEMGLVSVSNGVQVLGGYGFCSEYILQQYYRDLRIFPLYEGTTGIQSLDLLGRKAVMEDGKALMLLGTEIMESIQAASNYDDLRPYAGKLGEALQTTQEVMQFLLGFAQKGDFQRFVSDANLFMEFMGHIVIAWQWLQMATLAKEKLVTAAGGHHEAFYESKVHAMRFFFKYELVKIKSLAESLTDPETLTIATEKEIFA